MPGKSLRPTPARRTRQAVAPSTAPSAAQSATPTAPRPTSRPESRAAAPLQLDQALGHDQSDKRLDILRRIGTAGSISEAARAAGISYKAAWQAIETLGNLAGQALVEKVVGGSGGGGARLTAAGTRLLEAADLLNTARATVLARLAEATTPTRAAAGLIGLGLRTSMRNQLPCVVREIEPAGAMVRVRLELPGGAQLWSRITRESTQLLDLRPGRPALAMCKATAVNIAAQGSPTVNQNLLTGRLKRAGSARHGGELVLELAPGVDIVGFPAGSERLRPGQTATANMDESAVVIAISS